MIATSTFPKAFLDSVLYYFAFLDHILSHLKTRFPPDLEGALLATCLLPGNVNNISKETIADIKAEYAAHLPHPSSFEGEVATWKVHVAETNDQGMDLLFTCNFVDENKIFYLNIHVILLLLLLSLPVGSYSCERSFSALRRLRKHPSSLGLFRASPNCSGLS